MLSMTGYGTAEEHHNGLVLTMLVNSCNRKQTDFRISLPPELQFAEPNIRQHLGHHVKRGMVNVQVELSSESEATTELHINRPLARSLWKDLQELCRELELPDKPGLQHLLSAPEVLAPGMQLPPPETLMDMLTSALEKAVEGLIETRRQEGAHLKQDFKERLEKLHEILARIRAQAPRVPRYYGEQLRQRLDEHLPDLPVDEDALLREVALVAERCDITEEITRLQSHLEQFEPLLENDGVIGRKMDFLVQELFRETNTIGSKAHDSLIATAIVDFKTELDRIREQARNIE